MTLDYFFVYSSVVLTVIAQLLLKISAVKNDLASLKQPQLLFGYGLLTVALILNTLGLRSVPLHHMAAILPVTFILVPLGSVFFLGERQGRLFWMGSFFVFSGTMVFSFT